MKKSLLLITIAIIVISGMLIGSCAEPEAAPAPAPAPTPTPEKPAPAPEPGKPAPAPEPGKPAPAPAPGPAGTPVLPPPPGEFANGEYGGILRMIQPAGPQVLGGPRGGPMDVGNQFPALNALMDATADRTKGIGLEPFLCESVDDDVENKKIVFHLRKGVKFHDGTEMTADDCIWGYERMIDAGRMQFFNYFEGIDKIDDYTFQIRYNEYTNQLIQSWGWFYPRSKAAFMEGTGGSDDLEVQYAWEETHIVAAGPFKLVEWVRDSHITWTKFEDYWNAPLPYLDGIEVRYIPDPVTARALMEAGEADYWGAPPALDQKEMYAAGFKKISGWVGLVQSIWPNTSDPTSVWTDVRLRYALEYALDKPAIATALGHGLAQPLMQLAPPGEWGYDPEYPEREYNPDKARDLLRAAGYPNGLKTTMLIGNTPDAIDTGTAIKGYLDAVGIEVELDIADPGRYYGTVWGASQPGLSFMWSGMDVTNLCTYMRWFSTDPFTDLVYLGHTDEQRALDEEAKAYPLAPEQKEVTMRLFKYMNDGAYLIPVFQVPSADVVQPYVHSQRWRQGFVRWQMELIWMEKH